jgi:hypothetical protein
MALTVRSTVHFGVRPAQCPHSVNFQARTLFVFGRNDLRLSARLIERLFGLGQFHLLKAILYWDRDLQAFPIFHFSSPSHFAHKRTNTSFGTQRLQARRSGNATAAPTSDPFVSLLEAPSNELGGRLQQDLCPAVVARVKVLIGVRSFIQR